MTVENGVQQPVSVLAALGERLVVPDDDPLGYAQHASLAYEALIRRPDAASNQALFEVIGEGACLFDDPVPFQIAWPEVAAPMGSWRLWVAAAETGHDDWVTVQQQKRLNDETKVFCVKSGNLAVAMAEVCLYKLKIELAKPHKTPNERGQLTSALVEFKYRAAEDLNPKVAAQLDALRFAAAQSLLANGMPKDAGSIAGKIQNDEIRQQFAVLEAKARANRKPSLPIRQFFASSLGNGERDQKADGSGELTALRGLVRHVAACSFHQGANADVQLDFPQTQAPGAALAVKANWHAHVEALLRVGDLKSARELYRGGMFATLHPVSELDLRAAMQLAHSDNAQPDINVQTVEQLDEFPLGARRLEAGLRLAERTGADGISEPLRRELAADLIILRRITGALHRAIDPAVLADFEQFGVTLRGIPKPRLVSENPQIPPARQPEASQDQIK